MKRRGVTGFGRIKDGGLFDAATDFAHAGEFGDVDDAVAKPLFRPGATGDEQCGKGRHGDERFCVSHKFSIVGLSLRRNWHL
jgi:hypothetical protein